MLPLKFFPKKGAGFLNLLKGGLSPGKDPSLFAGFGAQNFLTRWYTPLCEAFVFPKGGPLKKQDLEKPSGALPSPFYKRRAGVFINILEKGAVFIKNVLS